MAPSLPDLLRKILEGKQIQTSTIDTYIKMNPSLNRYSSGFKLLWAKLTKNGINPPEATVDQVLDNLI